MSALPGIIVRIGAETKDFTRALNQSQGKMSTFSTYVKRIGLVMAGAFSATALVRFTSESITAASDLSEAINKMEVVFGDSATAVRLWGQDSVTAFGLSQQAAYEAAGTFGNLLTSFGAGQQEAADMSTALVQLAADLASFNNVSVEDALTALRSGLSGEMEPLKRFGITLSDTRLRSEAAAMGIKTTTKALDPLTKAMAGYSLIMKDSANAQGDFERTSDGLANTTRILQAAMEDAKATVGVGFVKAIEDATAAAGGPGGLADAIGDAAQEAGDFTRGIGVTIRELRRLSDEIQDASGGFVDLAGWFGKVAEFGYRWSPAGMIANFGKVERASEDAAEAQFLLEQGYRANARALPGVTSATYKYASSLDALKKSFGTAAGSRTARQMDSFGREIDKTSIYWKNAADEAGRYFDSLDKGSRGPGGGVSQTNKDLEKTLDLLKDINNDTFLSIETVGKYPKQVMGGVSDAIVQSANFTQEAINKQLEIIRKAETEIANISSSIVSKVMGSIGLQSTKEIMEDGKSKVVPLTAEEQVELLFGDINKQREAVTTIANTIGTALPPALLQMVLSQPPDTAIALANYLGANPDMTAQLANNYLDLATWTEEVLGQPMGQAHAKVGGQNATEMIQGAKDQIEKDAKAFTQFVSKKLKSKVVVEIEYREVNSPPAAVSNPMAGVQQYMARNGRSFM